MTDVTGLLLNVLSWPCTDSARSVCYIKDLFKGTWSLAEIFFQTKLLSRVSPRFCRFLSSHFRAKTIATLHFQPECFPLHSNASGRTSVFWLPWAMLKIFHWTCLFLHFYKVLCKPYSILWWYKEWKNETAAWAKEMVKAKIRVLHCLKIKFQRRKETQKRNFETGYKRYEVSKKLADTADKAHPRIHPSASSYIENFCHAVFLLINKCSCGPLRKQYLRGLTSFEVD